MGEIHPPARDHAADAAVAHRQDRRRAEVQERHVADRRADRHDRPLGGCGRAAGRSEGHARRPSSGRPTTNGKRRRNWASRIWSIKSEPYTMAAHHQDVWWRPTSDIPITEPRWVRAVEMRPGTAAGRKITHHAVAYLVQDDPDELRLRAGDPDLRRARVVDGMGHRQGLRPVSARTPASCCCRARRFPGTSTFTRWARRSATMSNSASGSTPKARSRSTAPI